MGRPKSLKEIPIIPGENIIKSDEFKKAYVGFVDSEGRIPKVGKEYGGKEVWVFIKKSAEDMGGLVGMGFVKVDVGKDGEPRYSITEKGKRILGGIE